MQAVLMTRRPLVGLSVAFVMGDALGLATGHWQVAAWAWLAVAVLWLAAQRCHSAAASLA